MCWAPSATLGLPYRPGARPNKPRKSTGARPHESRRAGSWHPRSCKQASKAVHGLRVLGIDLEGLAQIVESPQAVALLAEDGAQILEGHGIAGIGCKSLHGVLLGPQEVARPLVAERQGYAGVRVAGSELEAAVQQLSSLIELAEVHVAEAQVVEKSILGRFY